MFEAPAHGVHVARHQPAVGRLAERGRRAIRRAWLNMGFEQVSRHHGCEQPGHHQRGQDGQHRGPAKLLEEQARDAAHEGGGQKHRHQRKSGGNDGHTNLVGRLHRGLVGGLAHAQVACDVLNLDNRVVHQHPHHQGQRQQGHGVERVAKVLQTQKCRDHRQGQGGRGHQGGAPVAQKPPHHQHGEQCALVQQLHRALKVLRHRFGIVNGLRQADLRKACLQLGHCQPYATCHRNVAGSLGAEYFETNHLDAVEHGQGTRLGHSVANLSHVAQADAPAIGQGDLKQRQLIGCFDGGNGAHRLLGTADITAPAGGLLLHQTQAARNINRRDLQCGHARAVKLDPDFAVHPAHAFDCAHSGHSQQPFAHRVVDEPAQVLRVKRGVGGRGGKGQHHTPGGRGFGDGGVAHLAGQVGAHPGHCIPHIIDRLGDGFFKHKLHGHLDLAVEHLGVNVFNALQRGHGVLELARHLGFQLGWRRPGQRGADGDDRQLDIGEVLHHTGPVGQQASQRQQHKQHDGRHRILDRQRREVHGCWVLFERSSWRHLDQVAII